MPKLYITNHVTRDDNRSNTDQIMHNPTLFRIKVASVIANCHSLPCGGHAGVMKTVAKIHEAGFFWPTLHKDVNTFVKSCDSCQRTRNIRRRHEMPQNKILECEIFDVWSIDFMGPFVSSLGNVYILMAIDYVPKWVEALTSPTNDHKVVIKMFKKVLFQGSAYQRS